MPLKTFTSGRALMLLLFLVIFALSLFLLDSCKKDKEPGLPAGSDKATLEVNFTAKADGVPFVMGDEYSSTDSFNYKFTLLKFYMSQLKLIRADNSEVLAKDVELVDFRTDKPKLTFTYSVDPGTYQFINLGIGVDSINNDKSPNSFPLDHPLSSAQNTYWDMNSMYRFLLIEGLMDTTVDTVANYDVPFAVHTGFNQFYRTRKFAFPIELTKGVKKSITMEINIDSMLYNASNPMDFRHNHVSHGSDMVLTGKLSDNFINAITIK